MDFEKLKQDLSTLGTITRDTIDSGKIGIAMQLNEPFEENFNLAIDMINSQAGEEYPNVENAKQFEGVLKVVLRK